MVFHRTYLTMSRSHFKVELNQLMNNLLFNLKILIHKVFFYNSGSEPSAE